MFKKMAFLIALTVGAGFTSDAQAGVIFSDNFNSYAYELNWAPPANWTAPGPGAVDLIGETTSVTAFDFYPGNGGYVDLEGSNGIVGTLQSIASFAPGTYTLSFSLGGSARGAIDPVSKTTTITLGDFATSITLGPNSPLLLYSYTFTTTGGQLVFSDLANPGNQNVGNILDNVTVSAPEPTALALIAAGLLSLLGLSLLRRRVEI